MDCINTHVNGVYRGVQGKRQDDTLDRTLCSTLKLGNVCLGVSLLLLLFFMDLGSMLNYTLSSLHPGRVKVTPLQWPTRQRQEKPGFSCRFLPTTGQKKKKSAVGELRKGKQHSMQKLHLPDWNKLCRYLSLVTLPSSLHPFFEVCSKARSSLRTGRDQYFCSGGIFSNSMCAMSLESQQLILSSGSVSMGLDRRTKTSCHGIFCRNLELSLLILCGISFTKSLGTNPHQIQGMRGSGLIRCSLQDDLAIPAFLKLSHCFLEAPAINSSWVGARDVFFPGRIPDLAVKHLTVQHCTPGQGRSRGRGSAGCALCDLLVVHCVSG